MGAVATVITAHQGGWDEALFVIVPLLLIGMLFRAARQRVAEESAADVTHDAD